MYHHLHMYCAIVKNQDYISALIFSHVPSSHRLSVALTCGSSFDLFRSEASHCLPLTSNTSSHHTPAHQSTMMNARIAFRACLKRATRLPRTLRPACFSTLKDSYEHVLVEKREKVGLLTLNRPKALNALCDALFDDLIHAAKALDSDPEIGALVLTGSSKGSCAD